MFGIPPPPGPGGTEAAGPHTGDGTQVHAQTTTTTTASINSSFMDQLSNFIIG